MNFNSIKEYFYKLANRCYLLVLLPLAVFIYIYYEMMLKKIGPVIQDDSVSDIILAVLVALSLVNLTTVHWIARKRLKVYALEVGLGNKLDRYSEIVTLRISACSASSLALAVGVFFTGSEWFAVAFLVTLLWVLLQWPSSKRACRDLKLKGDEYQMVWYKKDRF